MRPGQGLRRDGPAHREAARGSSGPRARQRSPARAADRTSPRSSSTACCRARCRRSRASRPPRASSPPARHTRSAATSTTSFAAGSGSWTRGDRRRLRQGPGGGLADRARPLHGPDRVLARQPAEPGPAHPPRLDQLRARRPALLHRGPGPNRAALQRQRLGPSHRRARRPSAAARSCARTAGVELDRRDPGTLLGALPSLVLADTEATLGVGDSLVLYTDGMLDVRDRSSRRRSGLAHQASSPSRRAGAPTRSPRASPRRRSSATAASRATTSPSSSCTATAPVDRPVHVGCSGWVYPHWRERFYPKGVPQRRWLALLRRALRHGRDQQHLLPARLTAPAVEGWVDQSPPGFVFAVKASRYLTHVKRLTMLEQGTSSASTSPSSP